MQWKNSLHTKYNKILVLCEVSCNEQNMSFFVTNKIYSKISRAKICLITQKVLLIYLLRLFMLVCEKYSVDTPHSFDPLLFNFRIFCRILSIHQAPSHIKIYGHFTSCGPWLHPREFRFFLINPGNGIPFNHWGNHSAL